MEGQYPQEESAQYDPDSMDPFCEPSSGTSNQDSSHSSHEISPSQILPIPHPKSYINVLEEFCTRQKLTPTYQLISMDGMSHEPTFVYRLQIDGYEPTTGRGRRKQEAKLDAAKNLLLSMSNIKLPGDPIPIQQPALPAYCMDNSINANQSEPDHLTTTSSSAKSPMLPGLSNLAVSFASSIKLTDVQPLKQPEVPASTVPAIADNTSRIIGFSASVNHPVPTCREDNPVGSLQELTLSIRWPPPRFDLYLREGMAHDAVFTIVCFVWSYKATGKGKSKKLAKRVAAYNMYELLKNSQEVKELWQKRAEMYAAKTAQQRRHKTTIIPQRAPAMMDVHKDLYTSKLSTLETLRRMSPKMVLESLPDPLGFLREIATEVGFDILFEDLYDLSKPAKAVRPTPSQSALSPRPPDVPSSKPIPASVVDKSANAGSLIILTIPRQIVCFGSGTSKADARKAAIINALLYLQTVAAAPPGSAPVLESSGPTCREES